MAKDKKVVCKTCVEIGDAVLREMCEELGPDCEVLEHKFKRGELSSEELLKHLKKRFSPARVGKVVHKVAKKYK